jgi:monoamine oxidase
MRTSRIRHGLGWLKLGGTWWLALAVLLTTALRAAPAAAPEKTEVIIVGAGLSGLASAYELKKAKVPFHIVEVGPRVGGRVRTVTYKLKGQPDIRVDSGMEEYWQSNPAVELIKELGLPYTEGGAFASLMLEGALRLNLETPDAFQKKIFTRAEYESLQAFHAKVAPWIQEMRSGQRLRPELMKLKDISFEQFLGEQGLTSKVRNWIRISVECEMGTHWDRVSALDGLAEFGIFLWNGERSHRVTGGNDNFTQALAKAVGTGHISLNHRVTRIASNPGQGVEVQFLDIARNRNGIIKGRYVICTIPLFRLFEVQFVPPLSAQKQEAIRTQTWGSYFKSHVFLPAKSARFWTTTNGESMLPILSDSELGVIYDGNPDQKEPTKVISMLIHGDTAESFNLLPLDVIRTRLLDALDRFWPGISKEVINVEFYRFHPRAVAAWPVGRSRYDELSNEIRTPENSVYLAGDFTESSHSNGATLSARRVVQHILAARSKK